MGESKITLLAASGAGDGGCLKRTHQGWDWEWRRQRDKL